MNYRRHYERLIERARNRMLDGYVEVHHVLPKCMGGDDSPSNLVQLTAEEHYVAHQLLHKMHPEVRGLAFALIAMCGNAHGSRNNKVYGWIRRRVAEQVGHLSRSLWDDDEYRAKHAAAMQKLRESPEYQERMREAVSRRHKGRVKSRDEIEKFVRSKTGMKYRPMSAESRANMSAARHKVWEERRASGTDKLIAQKTRATRIANGSYHFTEEHRENIGKAGKGRKLSEEHKALLSAKLKAYRATQRTY